MSDASAQRPHRLVRRFWNPVEDRYHSYERPTYVEATCNRCGKRYVFQPTALPTRRYDPTSGGYEVPEGDVCGNIKGRGACQSCGKGFSSISWPNAAHLKIEVAGGILWAWNAEQLPGILARISGDKVALRTLTKNDWRLARIIGRIPKFATLKRNRERILREIDKWLIEGR